MRAQRGWHPVVRFAALALTGLGLVALGVAWVIPTSSGDAARTSTPAAVTDAGRGIAGAPRTRASAPTSARKTPSAVIESLTAEVGPAAASSQDKPKDESKPPRPLEADPPPPPSDAASDPVDPPQPPPPPPAAPEIPVSVACVSGNMADIVTFEPARSGGPVSCFVLLRASSAGATFSVVASATSDARAFSFPVVETGSAHYAVAAVGPGGESGRSAACDNGVVSMSVAVSPAGATLRASNGEVVLTLPAGAYSSTTTVSVAEAAGEIGGGLVRLAGIYSIAPSGPLGAPAALSVRYSLGVTHFQVSEKLLSAAGFATYDEVAGAWALATTASADGTYLTGPLSHFSYWTGATIQPHGTTRAAADYCSGVCHDLSAYPGSTVRYDSRDSQVCYNCHGNADAGLPPAGATGPNIQAELFQVSGQARPAGASTHPVATGDLYCTVCHDPHANPASSTGLLRSWDPVTGTYVQGGGGTSPGNAYCWTCHGTVRNRRVDYLVPGYYSSSGGDKKTKLQGTPHAGLTAENTGSPACNACHSGHGSPNGALVRPVVDGRVVAGADRTLCLACHEAPQGGWSGEPTYLLHDHSVTASSPSALSVRPGSGAAAGECGNCHDPHGTTERDYLADADNDLCYACHDAAGVNRTGVMYRGAGPYEASTHVAPRTDTRLARGAEVLDNGHFSDTRMQGSGVALDIGAELALKCPYTYQPYSSLVGGGVPTSMFTDGALATGAYWQQALLTQRGDGLATTDITVDLGRETFIGSAKVFGGRVGDGLVYRPETVEVLTSLDGVVFTTAGRSGTPGTQASNITHTLTEPRRARWVRFRVGRRTPMNCLEVEEVYVYGAGISGTWTSAPIDIAVDGALEGMRVVFDADIPAGSMVSEESAVSYDGGASWSAWQAAEGGRLVVEQGQSLDSALAKVRLTLTRNAAASTPIVSSAGVAVEYYTDWASAGWTASGLARGLCINCHDPHGTTVAGSTRATDDALCAECHDAAGGVRPAHYSYRGTAAFQASSHGAAGCAACHNPHGRETVWGTTDHMLDDDGEQVCYRCHTAVRSSFLAGGTAATDVRDRHDVTRADQGITGSTIECESCHQPHTASTTAPLADPRSPWAAFTATRIDPLSIPAGAMQRTTVDAIAETVIDGEVGRQSTNGVAATLLPVLGPERSGGPQHVLLDFDLSAVPPDAVILGASLSMVVSGSGDVTVHKVLRPWVPSEVTWLDASAAPGGAWSTPGGDVSVGAYAATHEQQWAAYTSVNVPAGERYPRKALEVTDLVRELHAGNGDGIALTALDRADSLTVYSSRGVAAEAPRLTISWCAPPSNPQEISDDVDFCLACHSGRVPNGYDGTEIPSVSQYLGREAHGGGVSSSPLPNGLKAPYTYGMAALSCVTCHDPHGSSSLYHLKTTVNGVYVGSVTSGSSAAFCYACHSKAALDLMDPPSHYSGSCLNDGCHGEGAFNGSVSSLNMHFE